MRHGCRLGWAGLGVLATLLLSAPAAPAAPPANDDFSASLTTTSTAPTTFTGTLGGATAQSGEPNHAGAAESPGCTGPACMQTVWWGWTAPRSGLVTMTTCDRVENTLNTQLAVYTGDAVDALDEVASNDDAWDPVAGRGMCTAQESVLSFRATAGTAYRIAVAGLGRDQHLTLRVSYRPFAYIDAWPGVRVNPERRPLTFRLLSPEPGAQLRCRMDGDPFGDCSEFERYWDRSFSEGAHMLQATATAGGDTFAFPASEPFIVDTTPPETAPDGAPRELSGSGYWWEIPLASSQRNQEQYFACSIDGAVRLRCAPAYTDSGKGEIGLIWQCAGEHTVDSSAVDAAGNIDPSPVHTTVTVPESAGTGACAAPEVSGGAP